MLESYYLDNKDKMLRDFDHNTGVVRHVLEQHQCYPKEVIDAIIHEARREYEDLIPQIPYIGGAQNPLTWNLVMSAQYLAAQGDESTRRECGDYWRADTEDTFEYWLNRFPRWLLRLRGWWQKLTPLLPLQLTETRGTFATASLSGTGYSARLRAMVRVLPSAWITRSAASASFIYSMMQRNAALHVQAGLPADTGNGIGITAHANTQRWRHRMRFSLRRAHVQHRISATGAFLFRRRQSGLRRW
ncbi:MAG: hypothetical protein U0694_02995 [Anaerolineae bacterium]